MPKVTLNLNDFKTLASGVRLDILRTLDGKKLSLNEIETATKLHKMTLHEHLSKLVESGFVNKIEREGHKWVYYKLSWKGESLLHPENTRIAVMFSVTFISLFFGIISLVNFAKERIAASQPADFLFTHKEDVIRAPVNSGESEALASSPDLTFLYITIAFLILFSILISISVWRYKKNKIPKL